jgi:anti-sigma B factor antagonist
MQERSARVNVTVEGDVTVAELTDKKILDEVNITEIGDQLNALVASGQKAKLLLDFSAVSHMSSSALGMLITVHKRIREKGGQLALCSIQPAIHQIFVITRLNEIFQIYKSRAEALERL